LIEGCMRPQNLSIGKAHEAQTGPLSCILSAM
jgi:hypothetical protein